VMRRAQRVARVGSAQLRQVAAVVKLEKLHQKLDIDNAAEPAFQIPLAAAGLQPLAHALDVAGIFALPGQSKCCRGHCLHHLAAEFPVAMNDAGPRQCLALPKLSLAFEIVALKLRQGDDEAARFSSGPEAHVYLVQAPERAQNRSGLDNALSKLCEEMKI